MRYYEFTQHLSEAEVRKSSHLKRYSSEVGLLFGLTGDPSRGFDPINPEDSIPSSTVDSATYDAIRKESHLFDEKMFREWASRAPKIKDGITKTLGYFPKKLYWVAGKSDDSNAADVKFDDPQCNGISVKDGGTLANLSPEQYGIPLQRGTDTFQHIGGDTYDKWKDNIFKLALSAVKRSPDERIQTHKGYPADFIRFNSKSQDFTLSGGDKTVTGSLEEILKSNDKNAIWQRPVGSWFQNNFSDPSVQIASKEFLRKLKDTVIQSVTKKLSNSNQISHICRIPDKSLFYVSPSELWYMKGKIEMPRLVLKDVMYAGADLETLPDEENLTESDGSKPKLTQTFKILIGPENSDETTVLRLCLFYPAQPFVGNMQTRLFPGSKRGEKSTFEVIGWELIDDNISGKYASPETVSLMRNVQSDLRTHASDFIWRAKQILRDFDANARKNKVNQAGLAHLRNVDSLIAKIEKNLAKRLKQSDVDPTKAGAAALIAQANQALYDLQMRKK